MRTNLVLNDELMREAMRYSKARSKRALVEEALQTYVEVKSAERRRRSYRDRLRDLDTRLRDVQLRDSPSDLLRADRDRR
ncbi:MAG TPA: type II toxin-antitoxin system VapB family antitoxin [Thermoanaerobaculia bacterium]|nr:type II toxin-antitoxin system VapB family antitoxin [Thermoanaerobaculia bacterium]